jgi:hypothetical protein
MAFSEELRFSQRIDLMIRLRLGMLLAYIDVDCESSPFTNDLLNLTSNMNSKLPSTYNSNISPRLSQSFCLASPTALPGS